MKVDKKFTLPNKKVRVEPMTENPGWITDKNHVAFFKMEGTADRFTVPLQRRGVFVNVLTDAEKQFLEGELGVDLGVYKKEGKASFWSNYIVKLDKYGSALDLSKPDEYIDYKVLLANKSLICPNYDQRTTAATFKYYIADSSEIAKSQKAIIDVNKKAYMYYGKMEDDAQALAAFLQVHSLSTKGVAARIDPESNINFLQEQVSIILDNSPRKFVEFMEDDNFGIRSIIAEGLLVGAVTKGAQGYETADGLVIGKTVHNAVTFLSLEVNGDVLLTIEARIKQAK